MLFGETSVTDYICTADMRVKSVIEVYLQVSVFKSMCKAYSLASMANSFANLCRCVPLLPLAIFAAALLAAISQWNLQSLLRIGSDDPKIQDAPPKIQDDPDVPPMIMSNELSRSVQWIPRCKAHLLQKLQRDETPPSALEMTQSPNPFHLSAMSWSNVSDFNLVYIKVEKVGGTTVSGVVKGIADKFNMSGVYGQEHWIQSEPGTVRFCLQTT